MSIWCSRTPHKFLTPVSLNFLLFGPDYFIFQRVKYSQIITMISLLIPLGCKRGRVRIEKWKECWCFFQWYILLNYLRNDKSSPILTSINLFFAQLYHLLIKKKVVFRSLRKIPLKTSLLIRDSSVSSKGEEIDFSQYFLNWVHRIEFI